MAPLQADEVGVRFLWFLGLEHSALCLGQNLRLDSSNKF